MKTSYAGSGRLQESPRLEDDRGSTQGDELPPADISRIARRCLDLAYADAPPSQKLDLYLPEGDSKPYPVIVHIHGGAFAMGDKRDVQLTPWLAALDHGYALASINYRMSGEAIFPAAVIDCKAAIRFLRGNANKYGLDRRHFGVVGPSAGANLAEMVAVTENVAELSDLTLGYAHESCAVQACVAWFGPTDFLKMDEQLADAGLGPCDHNEAESPESRYMGGKITELDPEWVQRANPITYVHEGIPPIYLQHGDRDHLVPMMQSAIFAQEIERQLGSGHVRFEILEGADHADPAFGTEENMSKAFAFLDKHLKGGGEEA